jgi:hypothetical protein
MLDAIESVTKNPVLAFVGTYHDYRDCFTKEGLHDESRIIFPISAPDLRIS